MISIQVKLFTSFKEAAGQATLDLQLEEPATVKDLLKSLSEKFGRNFNLLLFQDDEQIKEDVVIVLNNRILKITELNTPLKAADKVALMTAISGGD